MTEQRISRAQLQRAIQDMRQEGPLDPPRLFQAALAVKDERRDGTLITATELDAAITNYRALDLSREPADLAQAIMDRVRGVIRKEHAQTPAPTQTLAEQRAYLRERLRERFTSVQRERITITPAQPSTPPNPGGLGWPEDGTD